jgi:hypothetical protein
MPAGSNNTNWGCESDARTSPVPIPPWEPGPSKGSRIAQSPATKKGRGRLHGSGRGKRCLPGERAISSRRAHQGRDCEAAETQRIAENAPRWPDPMTNVSQSCRGSNGARWGLCLLLRTIRRGWGFSTICSSSPALAGRVCHGCACLRSRRWSWRGPTIRSCRSTQLIRNAGRIGGKKTRDQRRSKSVTSPHCCLGRHLRIGLQRPDCLAEVPVLCERLFRPVYLREQGFFAKLGCGTGDSALISRRSEKKLQKNQTLTSAPCFLAEQGCNAGEEAAS